MVVQKLVAAASARVLTELKGAYRFPERRYLRFQFVKPAVSDGQGGMVDIYQNHSRFECAQSASLAIGNCRNKMYRRWH